MAILGTTCIAFARVALVALELEVASAQTAFTAMVLRSTAVACTTTATSCAEFRLAAFCRRYSGREE